MGLKEITVVPPKTDGKEVPHPRIYVDSEQLAMLYKGWRWNAERKRKEAIAEALKETSAEKRL